MITKYSEYIKESLDNKFFKTYEETKEWLDLMKIKKYTINDDLTVDVDGDVDITSKNSTYIPVKFGKVEGYFFCFYIQLTTLVGTPNKVEGNFDCSGNQLTTLEGSPKEVKGNFDCSYNKLTTLIGSPNIVKKYFDCSNNKLTTLEGSPKEVNDYFYCSNNPFIKTLQGYTIYNLKKNIDKKWFSNLNIKIKEEYFDEHLEENPEIITLIDFELSDEFKQKWYYLLNANKFDLL